MKPVDWRTVLEGARHAVGEGRAQAALKLLARAQLLAPGRREIRFWRANALRLADRAHEAEAEFRALLQEKPGDSDTAFALAWLLREQGRARDTAAVLLDLARAPGADLPTLLKIAGFLRDSNRFEEAIDALRLALRLRPDDAALKFRLARLYQSTGRFDEALDQLHAVLDRDPSPGGAWLSLALLQRFSDRNSSDFRRLTRAAEAPQGQEAEVCLAFALGKAHDDLGEWSTAWRHFRRGNDLHRAMQPWDRAGWRRSLETALASPIHPVEPPAHPARHPVYVVGMLRSGTTLLESLLDRHPRIVGRGELNVLGHRARAGGGGDPAMRRSTADALWTHLRLDGPEDGYYIDKNPLNFRYLGFLAETVPEAHIIQVVRDARDTCLSCYFQLFAHPDAGFADDLDDLVDFYRGYRQLMDHWTAVLDGRILTIAYEDLVTDTRRTLQRAIGHLGLAWDDRLDRTPDAPRPIRTASTWQARQPVHRGSIGRWKHYRSFAPAFFDSLQAFGRG